MLPLEANPVELETRESGMGCACALLTVRCPRWLIARTVNESQRRCRSFDTVRREWYVPPGSTKSASIKLATLRRLWAHACHSAKRRAAGTSNRTTENARFKCEKQASSYLVPGIVVAERKLDSPHEQGVTISVSNTNGGTLIDKLCVQWHA